MTLAEVTAVIRKDVAWRVIVKAVLTVVGVSITLLMAAVPTILFVHGGIEGNRKDNEQIKEQVKDLTSAVGTLKLQVVIVDAELRTTRNEQNRKLDEQSRKLDQLLQQQHPRAQAPRAHVPTPPPRVAMPSR